VAEQPLEGEHDVKLDGELRRDNRPSPRAMSSKPC
jgi:hypothetical protein